MVAITEEKSRGFSFLPSGYVDLIRLKKSTTVEYGDFLSLYGRQPCKSFFHTLVGSETTTSFLLMNATITFNCSSPRLSYPSLLTMFIAAYLLPSIYTFTI